MAFDQTELGEMKSRGYFDRATGLRLIAEVERLRAKVSRQDNEIYRLSIVRESSDREIELVEENERLKEKYETETTAQGAD